MPVIYFTDQNMTFPEGPPVTPTVTDFPRKVEINPFAEDLLAKDKQDFEIAIKANFQNPKDQARIMDAFDAGEKAHYGTLRDNGDRFFTHPLAAAYILMNECDLKGNRRHFRDDAAADLIITALLHDALEDSDDIVNRKLASTIKNSLWGKQAYQEINKRFSRGPARYIVPLSKPVVEHQEIKTKEDARRKYLKGLRLPEVILVKMADRLHNLRTLSALPRERQLGIIAETEKAYYPIFRKIGRKYKREATILLKEMQKAIHKARVIIDAQEKFDEMMMTEGKTSNLSTPESVIPTTVFTEPTPQEESHDELNAGENI
jgi:(p)ppGpp synthase/HD superfamily hydrolase